MLQTVDRLWHHLSMFDRMVNRGERHPSESQQQLLSRSSKASCAYISELAHIIAGRDPERDKLTENRRELEEVSRSWKRLLKKESNDELSAQDQQLEIVGFCWRQVPREMAHLAESAGLGDGRGEAASAWQGAAPDRLVAELPLNWSMLVAGRYCSPYAAPGQGRNQDEHHRPVAANQCASRR